MNNEDFGLDVGWVIRKKSDAVSSRSESVVGNGSGELKQQQSKGRSGSETPSPKSSTVKIAELDAKNPDVTTHIEILGPNRIVKQRRNSNVDKEAGISGSAGVMNDSHVTNVFGFPTGRENSEGAGAGAGAASPPRTLSPSAATARVGRGRGSVSVGSSVASSMSEPLRRTQSASYPSEQSQKRKSGFFRSLFRRKSSTASSASTSPERQKGSRGSEPAAAAAGHTAADTDAGLKPPRGRSKSISAASTSEKKFHTPLAGDLLGYKGPGDAVSRADHTNDGGPLKRVQTESQVSQQDLDPRLEEFIRYYKEHGVNAFKNESVNPSAAGVEHEGNGFPPILQKPPVRAKASFSLDSTLVPEGQEATKFDTENEGQEKKRKIRLDKKGRPIPPHPPRSRLPPVLKLKPSYQQPPSSSSNHNYHLESSSHSPLSGASKFGSFLKRVTSHTDESVTSSQRISAASSLVSLSKDMDDSSIESSEQPINISVVPGLENLKPLKRVAFAANTYFNDPPQQICSRNPRKGEVEVKPDGSVVIHRLTPAEKREILENSSCGIVVGGTGQLKLINHDKNSSVANEHEGVALKQHAENEDDHATQRRNIELAAAEAAAEARAKDAPLDLQRTITNNEEEVTVNNSAKKVTIDKPMISRKKGSTTSLASMMSSDSGFLPSEDENDVLPPRNIKIPHDVVYTRCCHLREILPIPATMKQLKKGPTDPIPLLQLRNPKPSKVEVLSFSDFLSIAPVLCLSLDGVALSVEMLRIILSSITYKKNFEKLSLRNTPLDAEGWKVLSYFVSRCKSLNSLDVSMVPGLALNVQKPSKSSSNSNVNRMKCNMENRSDMNWSLLSAAVAAKGGLEEMIVSGAHMNMFQLQNFIDIAWTKTVRLGMAYNDLTFEQCEAIAKWMSNSRVTGLDLGFNDLDGKVRPFVDTVIEKTNKGKNVFKYLSLNSTNLSVPKGAKSENNDVLALLNVLCYCDNLKFLDLSNNPGLFPHSMRTLTAILPMSVSLVRLHLDYDNLSTTTVMQLAEVLPMCQRLNYISLLGTRLNIISASALATAVKNSNNIITMDIDYTNVPDRIKEKISIYSMRNTQSELEQINKEGGNDEHLKLRSLQEELARLLTENSASRRDYDTVVSNFYDRIQSVRSKLHAATEELFKLRINGELSTEGKETLIKFCFIEASFERGLKLLAKKSGKSGIFSGSKQNVSGKGKGSNQFSDSSDTPPPEAEADGKKWHRDPLSSSKYATSGHAALLPFHQPATESYEPADEAVELTGATDEVQNEAKEQLREEGDVLRRTRGLMMELQNTADKRGQKLNKEVLQRVGEGVDSERIKNLLLNQDISSVIALLDQLSAQGYNVDDIFKKKKDDKRSSTLLSPSASSSSTDDQRSSTVPEHSSDSKENHNGEVLEDSISSEEEEEEQMDRAFDDVLDTIERTREELMPGTTVSTKPST